MILPGDILRFWVEDVGPEKWFASDPALDADIRRRFADAWVAARDGAFKEWEASADGALALVILLDQFPRNMFRGTAEAFTTDTLARDVAGRAIARRFDLEVPLAIRHFFYLPLMHSENLADQDRCVALIAERCGRDHYSFPHAVQHRETIVRFGRFPARNSALGRTSTPKEVAFLARIHAD